MELEKTQVTLPLPVAIVIAGVLIAGAVFVNGRVNVLKSEEVLRNSNEVEQLAASATAEEELVVPRSGVELPAVWGDLGKKLVSVGAIDQKRFEELYKSQGTFTKEFDKLLNGENPGKLRITRENSAYVLNLLWALGLASKNPILDTGEMTDKRYGGADRFASTAGWTMALGNPMDHYSAHKFFNLTAQQQALVDKMSRQIYRPCCNNSTYFPDCNHGMAMLGLLELMASQGASEAEMYKASLAVNSYWFPETYITIQAYMKNKGIEWKNVKPEEVLGANYSSASGYGRVVSEIPARSVGGGGGSGCSVGGDSSVPSGSGCGI
ncbi:MAG: hypothetical protein HYV68_01540 [Candidatus Taylorbacteria bacterium]|nr:hypothetical protein [Candidatus Taylorbacteria bacterium]